jgi:hypothetical protein
MNYTIKLMARAATALILMSAFALTAQGQQSGPSTAQAERERQRDAIIRDQLEQERELMLRMTEKLRDSAPPTRTPRLAFAQIREDYVRLQIINNELAQAVAASTTLDLKLIAQSTSEIKKRADRLKDNLVLPEPESGDETRPKTTVGTEPEQLKSALGTLDRLILKMVRNPLFRNPKLIDATQSTQVRLELEEIVELSGQLKKRSEQLSKAAQKSQ